MLLDVYFGHGDLPAGGRSCLLDVLKPQTRVFLVTTAVDRLLDRLLLPGRTEPPLFGGSFWSGTVPRSLCTLRSPRSADIFRSVDGVCYAPDEAELISRGLSLDHSSSRMIFEKEFCIQF